ncbi:MAG: GNAT family N-acetyltransferase [Gammaproteobacteria bacterium]|nr:GNAT family N-acetyltransferase [Gammaproteobacteria bacterium]
MEIEFKKIDVERNFSTCFEFRKDSHFCSFGTIDDYEDTIGNYRERLTDRLNTRDWFYFHIWYDDQIIGQVEFKSYSFKPCYGYVHLIYVAPGYRGLGVADKAEEFIQSTLINLHCLGTILSVSRENKRAINHYSKWNWKYLKENPKHPLTDYYEREFSL